MSHNQTTKDRLLNAACNVFAERGFHDATVAEICEKAEANIAAVNYHFGDKESLYDAVWHHAFVRANSAYPVDARLPEHPELIDYLYSHASAILHRIFSETDTGLFAKLLYREMASPTLALDHIAEEVLQPQSEFVARALRTQLGSSISEAQFRRCMHSIIGQCAFYNFSRPLRERVLGCKTLSEEQIEETAKHIAVFSLGGLKEIQERKI
jgi:AcrR family transcriptional regulator